MDVRNSTYVQYTVKLIYGQHLTTRPKPVVSEHPKLPADVAAAGATRLEIRHSPACVKTFQQ